MKNLKTKVLQMRKYFSKVLIISLLTGTFLINSQTSEAQEKKQIDSIEAVRSPLIQELYQKAVFAEIYNYGLSDNGHILLKVDTAKMELFMAFANENNGAFTYLTNYFFLDKKLIGTQTSKNLIRRPNSKKYANWERDCTYLNDVLIKSRVTHNEPFSSQNDLRKGYGILNQVEIFYKTKKLKFPSVGNIGQFQD